MGSVLTTEEFAELFRSARCSARHMENRDRYDVPGEREELRRFLDGDWTESDERHERTGWERTVRGLVDQGRRFERVRIVPEPLTDYLRFELFGCRLNVEFGEDVRYLDRAEAVRLDLPDHDFWVFDSTTLVLLRFTADDRPLTHEIVTDPELVVRHESWMDVAMSHAIPYVDYLAQDPTRETAPVGWV
ncbi:MAG: hypothetical protein GEU83_08965 [Pseudonocardiaceae bacterium]|nr:hypothetical protein [Pseudonocardiaceae bacterium]